MATGDHDARLALNYEDIKTHLDAAYGHYESARLLRVRQNELSFLIKKTNIMERAASWDEWSASPEGRACSEQWQSCLVRQMQAAAIAKKSMYLQPKSLQGLAHYSVAALCCEFPSTPFDRMPMSQAKMILQLARLSGVDLPALVFDCATRSARKDRRAGFEVTEEKLNRLLRPALDRRSLADAANAVLTFLRVHNLEVRRRLF